MKSALIRSLRLATQEALVEYLRYSADTENEDLCYKCKTGGFLILCDGCMNACHCECDEPPMDAIPEGVWYCTQCRSKNIHKLNRSESARISSVRTLKSTAKSTKSMTEETPITIQSILKNYVPYVARDDPVTRIMQREYWKNLVNQRNEYDHFCNKFQRIIRRRKSSKRERIVEASKCKKDRATLSSDLEIINGAAMPVHYLSDESEDDDEKKSAPLENRKKKRIRRHNLTPASNLQDKTTHYESHTTDEDQTSEAAALLRKLEVPRRRRRRIHYQSVDSTVQSIHGVDQCEDSEQCKIFIRYRYNNESDDQMKLVKREAKYQPEKGIVTRSLIESILVQDCAVDVSHISEIRYYDHDEGGWLSMKDKTCFSVETHRSKGEEGNEATSEQYKRVRVTLIVYTKHA